MSMPAIDNISSETNTSFRSGPKEVGTLEHREIPIVAIEPHLEFVSAVIKREHPPLPIPSTKAVVSVPNHPIISDDFPEKNSLQKQFAEACRKTYNLLETIHRPPPSVIIKETDVLPAYEGFTGLSNPTGRCVMNASLQSLCFIFKTLLKKETEQGSAMLEQKLASRFPELWKFICGECLTEKECTLLHRELAHAMAEDFWFSFFTEQGIGQAAVDKGYTKGHKGSAPGVIASIYLHGLEAPKIYFQKSEGEKRELHSQQTMRIDCSSLPQKDQPLVQEVVRAYLASLKYQLIEPTPPLVVLQLVKANIPLQGTMQPIILPHQNGGEVTYYPKLINSDPSDHNYCFIQEKGEWYEVNDTIIGRIPSSFEKELEDYCAREGIAMIVYTKDPRSQPSRFSQEPEENILTLITQWEQSQCYPPRFIINTGAKILHQSFLLPHFSRVYHAQGLHDDLEEAMLRANNIRAQISTLSEAERIPLYEEELMQWEKLKELWTQQAQEYTQGKAKFDNRTFCYDPWKRCNYNPWGGYEQQALLEATKATRKIETLQRSRASIVASLALDKLRAINPQQQEVWKEAVREALVAVEKVEHLEAERVNFLKGNYSDKKEAINLAQEEQEHWHLLKIALNTLSQLEREKDLSHSEFLKVISNGIEATAKIVGFYLKKNRQLKEKNPAKEQNTQHHNFWKSQLKNLLTLKGEKE